jgi:hypothetical protein
MARLRDGRERRPLSLAECRLALLIGPIQGDPNEDELRLAWELLDAEVMGDPPPCTRPWAFWRFELGEDRPRSRAGEVVRLAELGVLTPEELARLRERANEARLRIGTGRERISGDISVDAQAVELWERVSAAVNGE